MNQQPDKLFKEKLENFSRPVSPNAWRRIESRLDKKNSKALWLKIAAAFLLLSVATALIWNNQRTKEPQPLAKQEVKVKSLGDLEKHEIPVEKEKPITQEVPETPPADLQKKHDQKITKEIKKTTTEKPVVQQALQIDVQPEENITSIEEPQNNIVTQELENAETKAVADHENSRVIIIYSAEEVNEKYLNKKSLAEATPDEKKASTLKKLLDKAYDLKHNQDPFGDLRQKKNEILALNFKTEKQRSQNK